MSSKKRSSAAKMPRDTVISAKKNTSIRSSVSSKKKSKIAPMLASRTASSKKKQKKTQPQKTSKKKTQSNKRIIRSRHIIGKAADSYPNAGDISKMTNEGWLLHERVVGGFEVPDPKRKEGRIPLLDKKKRPITSFIEFFEVTRDNQQTLQVYLSGNCLIRMDDEWWLYRTPLTENQERYLSNDWTPKQIVFLPVPPAVRSARLFDVMGGAKASSTFWSKTQRVLLTGAQALTRVGTMAAATAGAAVGAAGGMIHGAVKDGPSIFGAVSGIGQGAKGAAESVLQAGGKLDTGISQKIDLLRAQRQKAVTPIIVDWDGWAWKVGKNLEIELDPEHPPFYRVKNSINPSKPKPYPFLRSRSMAMPSLPGSIASSSPPATSLSLQLIAKPQFLQQIAAQQTPGQELEELQQLARMTGSDVSQVTEDLAQYQEMEEQEKQNAAAWGM